MQRMTSRLSDKRLFIADLARRLARMESRRTPMHPLLYRLLSKRLRQATAGFGDVALAGRFGPLNPVVAAVLEDRHFNSFGQLPGTGAVQACKLAKGLFTRLGVRRLSACGAADMR
jgi:hypothetical protein